MIDDPFLNESGRTNMGDLNGTPSTPTVKLFGADGQPSNEPTAEQQAELQKITHAMFHSDGVSWHKDDDESKVQGEDMFFPKLSIKNLADKFGVSRPHKDFFPDERNMFVQAFSNDVAEYLFGTPAFNEVSTRNGVAFRPNKEWERLPVRK